MCFIINYQHVLNKENIWKKWIQPNKDIINIYFFYKDLKKIQSDWIKKHCIPENCIVETNYYHVVPAYLSVLNFAFKHDEKNIWFCMLSDSCCPIISPTRFRYLFFKHYEKSLFAWKQAWWNPNFHKRGNLAKLSKELWLANDPWFILTRKNVIQIFNFVTTQKTTTKIICEGGLANESLFAIIFKIYKQLENSNINCIVSHLADWNRRSSPTSPHVFKNGDADDINFIDKELERNPCAIFIRKIAVEFPDNILWEYIYEKTKKHDKLLKIKYARYTYKRVVQNVFYIMVIYIFYIILL